MIPTIIITLLLASMIRRAYKHDKKNRGEICWTKHLLIWFPPQTEQKTLRKLGETDSEEDLKWDLVSTAQLFGKLKKGKTCSAARQKQILTSKLNAFKVTKQFFICGAEARNYWRKCEGFSVCETEPKLLRMQTNSTQRPKQQNSKHCEFFSLSDSFAWESFWAYLSWLSHYGSFEENAGACGFRRKSLSYKAFSAS